MSDKTLPEYIYIKLNEDNKLEITTKDDGSLFIKEEQYMKDTLEKVHEQLDVALQGISLEDVLKGYAKSPLKEV